MKFGQSIARSGSKRGNTPNIGNKSRPEEEVASFTDIPVFLERVNHLTPAVDSAIPAPSQLGHR